MDWYEISKQTLSESFMEEHCDSLFWTIVSKKQILSEDFIRKYQNKVHWMHICEYQNLSESFIIEMKNYISWNYIFRFQNISYPFIIKYFSHSLNMSALRSNKHVKHSFTNEQWKSISDISFFSD